MMAAIKNKAARTLTLAACMAWGTPACASARNGTGLVWPTETLAAQSWADHDERY
jgi:hypothetical protein